MPRRTSLIVLLLTVTALTTVSSAAAGLAQFDPSPVTFGAVQVGNSPALQVTVTNSSTDGTPMTIADPNDLSISGDAAFNVGQDNCNGKTLQPTTDSCTFTVTFSPTAAVGYNATVTVHSDSGDDPVSVSGTGTPAPAPAIGVTPNPFDFGLQKKGTTSGPQQFSVTNAGDSGTTLHISDVSIAAGSDPAFQISSNGCANTAPCNVSVTFAPGATGPLSGGLSITSPDTAAPVIVPLSGTGAVPTASAPGTVAFSTPVNTPTVVPVTLTNSGNADLAVQGATLSGSNAFTNSGTGDCGHVVLHPTGSCQAKIQFNPGSPGTFNGTLTFTDDDNSSAGSTQQVQLVGTVKVPGIQANPTTVTFGTLVEGRITGGTAVTVKNIGDANLHISNVRIGGLNPGAFVLQSQNCSDGAIVPGDTCTASVRFAPSKASGRTATLVFVNDAGPDQSVPLTGTGQRPPDGGHLRAAAGCSDASLSWQNPNAPLFKREIVVRGRRHYPKSVRDGVIVKHSGASVIDTGPTQFHTYRYTVFSRYGSYNGRKLFYSSGMHAKIHTGRICTPRNGGLIRDLTPTVDWTGYTGTRSYAFILQHGGKTIWVHYVRRSRFHIPASWRYAGATRSLAHGSSYSFFLYAYTRHRPNGITIGQTSWSER